MDFSFFQKKPNTCLKKMELQRKSHRTSITCLRSNNLLQNQIQDKEYHSHKQRSFIVNQSRTSSNNIFKTKIKPYSHVAFFSFSMVETFVSKCGESNSDLIWELKRIWIIRKLPFYQEFIKEFQIITEWDQQSCTFLKKYILKEFVQQPWRYLKLLRYLHERESCLEWDTNLHIKLQKQFKIPNNYEDLILILNFLFFIWGIIKNSTYLYGGLLRNWQEICKNVVNFWVDNPKVLNKALGMTHNRWKEFDWFSVFVETTVSAQSVPFPKKNINDEMSIKRKSQQNVDMEFSVFGKRSCV